MHGPVGKQGQLPEVVSSSMLLHELVVSAVLVPGLVLGKPATNVVFAVTGLSVAPPGAVSLR